MKKNNLKKKNFNDDLYRKKKGKSDLELNFINIILFVCAY